MSFRQETTVRRLPVLPSRDNSSPQLKPGVAQELLAEIDATLAEIPALLAERGDEAARESLREQEAVRGLKAMMLTRNLEVCRALLRGERVRWNVLDYWQAERFGLRVRPKDGRVCLDDFNDVRRPA